MKHWAGQDDRPGDVQGFCDAQRQFSPLLSVRFSLHLLSEAAGTAIHCFRAKNAVQQSLLLIHIKARTPVAAAARFPAPEETAAALTMP